MKVGDLVQRLFFPRRLGLVVDVDSHGNRYAKVLYTDADAHEWVSFELLEVLNENR
jgi:hypothetical protein